jgi:hypothetical protein
MLLATTALAMPAASAADLGVLTSLDVCNTLGLSGLTLSSDSNCLQISGEVSYEFLWGDYKGDLPVLARPIAAPSTGPMTMAARATGIAGSMPISEFAGTAPSDFGPAKAVLRIEGYNYQEVENLVAVPDQGLELDRAYVSVGDQTVLTAGLVADSIFNEDDDEAFGWLPSFISDETSGVAFDGGAGNYEIGGHAIQLVSKLGNGVSAGVALEDLDGDGSLVGVVSYGGETVSAHLSVMAGDILDGSFDELAYHAGVTATLQTFKLRAALAGNNSGWWNALASAEAVLDMFTLAATVDATSERELGLVGSGEAKLNDRFTVKLAARYLDPDTALADDHGTEIRGRVEYALTEQLTLAGEGGHLWTASGAIGGAQSITDGLLELTWKPGGGFKSTAAIGANTIGAYKASFTASKSF